MNDENWPSINTSDLALQRQSFLNSHCTFSVSHFGISWYLNKVELPYPGLNAIRAMRSLDLSFEIYGFYEFQAKVVTSWCLNSS